MRRWHRWIMTVGIVLLAWWAGSGVVLALYDASDARQVWAIEGGGPGARLTDADATAAAVPEPASLAAGIGTALADAGRMPIASVDLQRAGPLTRLEFATADGDRERMRRYDAATGAPISALEADGDPDRPQPGYVQRRNALKSWHRGNVAGLPGQLLGLAAGITLAALGVTGVLLYLELWRARRRLGRRGLFWTARESRWRRLHRWVSIIAAAFLLNMAITGAVLAYGEIQLALFLRYHIGAPPYPRPSPLPPYSEHALAGDIPAMLETSYRAARAARPAARIVAVDLVVRDGGPKGLVHLGGAAAAVLAFDAVSGAPVTDRATSGRQAGNGYFADWHQVVKRLHRGDIIGHFAGRYVDIAAGLALVYLVASAAVLYWSLLRQRRATGRGALFWR